MIKLLAVFSGFLSIAIACALLTGTPAAQASMNVGLPALKKLLPQSTIERVGCGPYGDGYICRRRCWTDDYGQIRCKRVCRPCGY